MEIIFTRGEGRTYTTTALRDDGVLLQVPSYDRISALPHDIAHFIVEHGLGLTYSFWGCIARGALFPGIKVVSGRQPVHATERSQAILREAGQGGTEGEVFVGVLLGIVHADRETDEKALRAELANMWQPDKPSRAMPDVEEAQRVCAALRETQRQWQALKEGESLTFIWPSEKRRVKEAGRKRTRAVAR